MKNTVKRNGDLTSGNVTYLRNNTTNFCSIRKHPLANRKNGLCIEDSFHEILFLERMRTERSGKTFLLMTIDISALLAYHKGISREIFQAFDNYIRDIDSIGWDRTDITIGIIFTEINMRDRSLLIEKTYTILSSILDVEKLKKVNINCHTFPEDDGRRHLCYEEKKEAGDSL